MNVKDLTSLLKPYFKSVYCNVITLGKKVTPRYWDGSEYVYVGLDEKECRKAYIRELADVQTLAEDCGGCTPMYHMKHTYRVVIYIREKNCGEDYNKFKFRLLRLFSSKDIKVKTIIENKQRLARMEQSTDLILMGDVIYLAFDIELLEKINHCCPEELDECEPINECKKC